MSDFLEKHGLPEFIGFIEEKNDLFLYYSLNKLLN